MQLDGLQFFIKSGSAVIPFLWQNMIYSGIVLLISWILIAIGKVKSARWQHALWLLVLIRLVLPPNFSHPLSSRNLLAKLPFYEKIIHYFHFDQNRNWFDINGNYGTSIDDQSTYASNDTKIRKPNQAQQARIFAGLFFAWLAGISLLFMIYLKKLNRFHQVIKRATPVENQKILQIAKDWCAHFRIKKSVRLVSSDEYSSPFTIGILHPIIFLPASVIKNEHQFHLESIIAHELAHIKRRDNIWMKIQSLLQIIYFFNPVAWYVNSKIGLSRECICDSMVLSREKIAIANYGSGIMTVLKLNLFGADEINVLPGFGSQTKKMMYRINHLKGTKMKGKYQSLLIFGTLFFLVIFVLPMAGSVLNKDARPENSNFQLIAAENSFSNNDEISLQNESVEFALPLKTGRISAPFGNMKDPYNKKIVHHNGIDIAAPIGTEIFAAADGVVEIAAVEKGLGKHILLQHGNGYQTFYSHCDSLLVQKGQQVKSDDVIAHVGTTGRSTGPHLHFEIRKDGKPQDPQNYLDFKMLKLAK
ncbi:M23/M56 family metallopeptidase [candidate division KSB1 bacterium]|nr:M23/M56 family metallopeptidase [candidate division KSB1 bacterium]